MDETNKPETSLKALLDASTEVLDYISNTNSTLVDNTELYKTLMQLYVKQNITNTISSTKRQGGGNYPPKQPGLISAGQTKFVKDLMEQKKIVALKPLLDKTFGEGKTLETLTSQEASKLIDVLKLAEISTKGNVPKYTVHKVGSL